jgi:tetratricopeptide (TPR) repeat protein
MERPYSVEYPEPSGPPQLTTFYSFKGGVGRTQSLYNVGVRLAGLRRKVLMVDVDLEAPGLSIGALDDQERNAKDGFAEIARDLLLELKVMIEEGDPDLFTEVIADYQDRLDRALHIIDVPMPSRNEGKKDLAERLRDEMGITDFPSGSLALLSSGRINPDYPRRMIDVEIDEAFEHDLSDEQQDRLPELLDAAGLHLAGVPDNLGLVFTAVLRFLLRNATDPTTEDQFRHVLIDSRSGLADVGGLCLRGLPDSRVVLSGLNKQNLEGTRMVLNTLSREERGADELIVVFSPVPEGEADLVDERIETAKDTLTFRDADGEDRISEEQIQLLHYHPRIALEETPFTESFHRRTRIFDEYENLTDDLLELTGSDARSLVSDALERFREDDSEDETSQEEAENRYAKLASELIPAAFLDEDHVELTVAGLCTQLQRNGPYELEATSLLDLFVALSSEDFVVLGIATDFYNEVKRNRAESKNRRLMLQRNVELYERITDQKSDDHTAWYNLGTSLSQLAQLAQDNNPNRAVSLYQEAFEKFQETVEIKPDEHDAWYNWGTQLGQLAQLVQEDDPDRADSLYQKAFEKFQKAVDIKPDKYWTWHNWGTQLGRLAQLVQDDDSAHAVSLYQEAFEKYQKAVDIKPDDFQTYYNWGRALIRLGRLLRSKNQSQKASQAFSDAAEKLRAALSNDAHLRALFWLIVALAERDTDDDIAKAADLLDTALNKNPEFVYWFKIEDAEVVRTHPELREILDEYREKGNENEVEEDPESPDDLDAPDLSD